MKDKFFTLYNGVTIPACGFGTWQIENGDTAYNSTMWALKAGYRHIDTAYAYENEESVGKAIKDSGLKREEVFVTTKLPSHIKTYEGAIKHFHESLKNLGLDYIDLYLIHAPWPWSNIGENCDEGNIEAWKAFIDLYNQKLIRSIGVSNFSIRDIENIVNATGVKPMANQIRYFIGNTQKELTKYCQDNDILVEAYSPFATGGLLDNQKIQEIANKYNTDIPHICLQFCIQNNTLPLPKSTHEERIKGNLVTGFTIEQEDMDYLNSLVFDEFKRKLRS